MRKILTALAIGLASIAGLILFIIIGTVLCAKSIEFFLLILVLIASAIAYTELQ